MTAEPAGGGSGGGADLAPVEIAASVAPAAGLVEAVEAWRLRLARAGLTCRAVALHGADPQYRLELPAALPGLAARWHELRDQARAGSPASLAQAAGQTAGQAAGQAAGQPGADLLLVTAIQLPDGQAGAVGLVLAPPHSERMVEQVLLALGWLQLALAATQLMRSQRATRLLDLLGQVASQHRARAAAQEWINRSAAWAREEAPAQAQTFGLMLFEMRGGQPRWWVAADTAWAETESPTIQAAAEVAAQAAVEQQEVRLAHAWAMPVLEDGRAVVVLVARVDTPGGAGLPEPAAAVLRASLGLAEPLLRRWREAERPLWRHHLDSALAGWRKLREPGHLAWKAGAVAAVLALAVLLMWPVPDRVSANMVIEGRLRQVVTAPFDGFIGQVLVRPGERVSRGQLLARMDDRDLKLEQARYSSEREQAAGRLRQAMTDHESAATALAMAEVQQAEAQLSLVEARLARTSLTAPLDGLVISGDWVQQIGGPLETGKELFEIVAGEGYRVVLHVPDRDIARVRVGQTGALRLTGQPNASHAFRVANLTATASVQDTVNGFRVEADWVGELPPLSPGMQGVGKIEVGTANLLTVWTRSSIDWLRLKIWAWWW